LQLISSYDYLLVISYNLLWRVCFKPYKEVSNV